MYITYLYLPSEKLLESFRNLLSRNGTAIFFKKNALHLAICILINGFKQQQQQQKRHC